MECPVLDPRQLERIEGVHRGFLYQHLYGVGCLLLAPGAGAVSVFLERDEDVEVTLPDQHIYGQIRTRAQPLSPSDIGDALSRFESLRAEHTNGNRKGSASFWIVSNVPPGPVLRAQIDEPPWPNDVILRWPEHVGQPLPALPPAWPDVATAFRWCSTVAASLPFASLLPDTLVWKLAGLAQLKSSGAGTGVHSFLVQDLPQFFEQMAVQIQHFPSVPTHYRPQAGEPPLLSNDRVRFIVGFSGAGKTVWASQAALHLPVPACYFDVGDIPAGGVVTSLARELTGSFFGSAKGALGQILLPGASGLDMLRLLDRRLIIEDRDALVVIDNGHRVPDDLLRAIIEATTRLRIVVLAQPDGNLHRLLARLGMKEAHLSGWSPDEVAAGLSDSGCRADYAVCQRLIDLTGGLPLFVQSAMSIAAAQHDGDLSKLCDALESQTHVIATAQEIILARLFDSLPDQAKDILAILSVADCPLTKDEAAQVLEQAGGILAPSGVRTIRKDLVPLGIIQLYGGQRLGVHDAIRLLGRHRLRDLGDGYSQRVYSALKKVMEVSLLEQRDVSRFGLYVRLLGLTGDVATLADLAGEEMFHEFGLSPEFKAVLEEAAQREDLPAAIRFWALDAVVFAELSEDAGRIDEHLEEMSRLVKQNGLPRRERLALEMKRMLSAAKRGQESEVYRILRELEAGMPDEQRYLWVLKYNAACAMYFIGQYGSADKLCGEVIDAYLNELALTPARVFGKNPAEIWPLLPKTDTATDDLKHLADSLDLHARCCNKLGVQSGLARAHAFKFYEMIGAISSALKVGQDFVDEFLQYGDPSGARQVFEEHLLPLVSAARMVDRVVPLRSHYAVVLAYCGDFVAADAEMSRLRPYEAGLREDGRSELQTQRKLIGKIKRGTVALPPRVAPSTHTRKVSRNGRCPCGSGKKYKRCHGRGE